MPMRCAFTLPTLARGSIRAFLFALSAAACVLASDPPAATRPTKDADVRKQLCGVWVGYVVEGKGENPDRGPGKFELTISETEIRGIELKTDGDRVDQGKGTYTLGLADQPGQLDATKVVERGRPQAFVGIYVLEGDTLKWCVSPQKKRPATFETAKGQFLMILKRTQKIEDRG